MTTQGPSTTTSIQDFATQLAGTHFWLCVIYTKGISEDEDMATICAEIGDLQQTGGLCIVANLEDAITMAVLSRTVEVANTYNAPIFSISLGEEGLPNEAVRSDSHFHVSSAGVGRHDQLLFVTQVLREILNILKARRG